jgi:hypothetical protein
MKLFYSRLCRTLTTITLIISLNISVKAQLTSTGDLVFTGFQASGPTTNTDQFAFVPLKSLPVGNVIKFTDNAWNSGTLAFNPTESNITFTVTGATIPAGRELRIILGPPAQALYTNGAIAGTVVVTGTISLPTSGDQIFAYPGTDADNLPSVFFSGIHMNVESGCGVTTAAGWEPSTCVFPTSPSNNTSQKPAALTTDVNAFWSPTEHDNAKFVGCGLPLSTAAAVRTAVNNPTTPTNWNYDDAGAALPPWGVTMSGCAFLGLSPLPVTLLSFDGRLNSDKTVTVIWKVAQQQDIQEYIVEKSLNGNVFWQLGAVGAGTGAATYTYNDMQPSTGKNYYRLKMVEISGKTYYSPIAVVNLKAGVTTISYPNPVTDKLTIQQFGTIQNKTAVLSDAQGKIMQQIRLTSLQQDVNMKMYPAGVYLLKMEDGTVFKLVKQ